MYILCIILIKNASVQCRLGLVSKTSGQLNLKSLKEYDMMSVCLPHIHQSGQSNTRQNPV